MFFREIDGDNQRPLLFPCGFYIAFSSELRAITFRLVSFLPVKKHKAAFGAANAKLTASLTERQQQMQQQQ